MARILRRLRIDEVSSVDVGAGHGVKVMLMKRDFSAGRRRADAKSGAALPDGSFPIENKSDLHNAMQAVGRAKDPAKARAHIRARAAALGLTSELSDSFKKGNDMPKENIFAKMFAKMTGGSDNAVVIDKANAGLAESIASILGDATVTPEQQAAALNESFEQHGEFLKSNLTAGPVVVTKEGGSQMDLVLLRKVLGLSDTATEDDVTKALAKQASDLAILNKRHELGVAILKADFSPDERAHYDKIGKAKADGSGEPDEDDAQNRFRSASKSDRAVLMKAAEPKLPEYVSKAMEENEALKKRLAALEGTSELTVLNKRAVDIGLLEAEGATIQKAYAGDKASVDRLLDFVKQGFAAAKAGGVFKEFGASGSGSDATPYEQLMQKAKDLLAKEPAIGTVEKAFAKVFEDPANATLVAKERAGNRPAAVA
jgi:hypothetical protein